MLHGWTIHPHVDLFILLYPIVTIKYSNILVLYFDFEHLACSQDLYFIVLIHVLIVICVWATWGAYGVRRMNSVQVRVKHEV